MKKNLQIECGVVWAWAGLKLKPKLDVIKAITIAEEFHSFFTPFVSINY